MTEISRRKFIQLSVLGSAVTVAGCDSHNNTRYNPGIYSAEVDGTYGGYNNRVLPYLNQPTGMDDGVPQYFASVCKMCSAGCGIYVRTMGGRALQIQGNPLDPISQGSICARGVGALQYLYNPDRVRFPQTRPSRNETRKEPGWPAAMTQATQALQASRGKIAVLVDGVAVGTSPTLLNTAREFTKSVGGTMTVYSLFDDAPWRAAAKAVYGKDQLPAYKLSEADVIISFAGDFLEAWPSPVLYGREYGDFRQGPRRTNGDHGTFIYIGPRLSQTAANADQWLPCRPGTEAQVAQAIATAMTGGSVADAAQASGLTEQQIQTAAETFKGAGTRAVAVAGNGLMTSADSTAAFTAVESLNTHVKSQCVGFGTYALPMTTPAGEGRGYAGIQKLVQQINSGNVNTLVILGQANAVFTLPTADNIVQALTRVPFILAVAPFIDETTQYADVILPSRTFLEEWGDGEPAVVPAGTRMATVQQAIVNPEYIGGEGGGTNDLERFVPWMDTRSMSDILASLASNVGHPLTSPDGLSAVRKNWSSIGQADSTEADPNNDTKWVSTVATGGYWTEAATGGAGAAQGAATAAAPTPAASIMAPAASPASDGSFPLLTYPGLYWTDGRGANVPWHQDIAEPMSMAVYNSWVEMNIQTAEQYHIRTGDIVRLTSPHGSIDAVALPSPGIHPDVLSMPIGQGHTAYGRYATDVGTNPLGILDPTADSQTGAFAYCATHVKLEKVASAQSGFNGNVTLVVTQDRPGGVEPEAVMALIHDTAKERKAIALKQDS